MTAPMRLTWWGHSTVLLEVAGLRIVTDPVLRRRVGLLRHVGPHPHVAPRTSEPVEGGLAGVDVVLLSHLHHDHCDLPTLRRLDAPVVLAPSGAAGWLSGRGVHGVREAAPGERLAPAPGVAVTVVPARHSGRREPWGPTAAAVGHVVDAATGTVWFAGDTGLFAAMRDLASLARATTIDVAVVPVWGWGPTLGRGHLDPEEAAEAVRRVGARHGVPVHWGSLHPAGLGRSMRHHLRTPGERFARAIAASRGPSDRAAHVLSIGQTLVLPAPSRGGCTGASAP